MSYFWTTKLFAQKFGNQSCFYLKSTPEDQNFFKLKKYIRAISTDKFWPSVNHNWTKSYFFLINSTYNSYQDQILSVSYQSGADHIIFDAPTTANRRQLPRQTTAQATTARVDNCPGKTTAQIRQLPRYDNCPGRQLPQYDNCPSVTTAQV